MTKTEKRPDFATMPLKDLPYAGGSFSGKPMVSETTLALVVLDPSGIGLTPEEQSIITRRLFDYMQDCSFRQGYEAARQSASYRIKDLLMPPIPEQAGERPVGRPMSKKIASKPFWARVRWGPGPVADRSIVTYRFATEAERAAFLLGVEESNGRMNWDSEWGEGPLTPVPREWKRDE